MRVSDLPVLLEQQERDIKELKDEVKYLADKIERLTRPEKRYSPPPPRQSEYAARRVFLAHIDAKKYDKEVVYDILSQYGEIDNIRMEDNVDGNAFTWAIVAFETEQGCRECKDHSRQLFQDHSFKVKDFHDKKRTRLV